MPFELSLSVGLAFAVGLVGGFLAGFILGAKKRPFGAQPILGAKKEFFGARVRIDGVVPGPMNNVRVTGVVELDEGTILMKLSGRVYDNESHDQRDTDALATDIPYSGMGTTRSFNGLLSSAPIGSPIPDRVIVWAEWQIPGMGSDPPVDDTSRDRFNFPRPTP